MELHPAIFAFSIPWMIVEWMWTIGGLIMTRENQSVGRETTTTTTIITCPSAASSVTHPYWGI
jgi:hypothetical protein